MQNVQGVVWRMGFLFGLVLEYLHLFAKHVKVYFCIISKEMKS